MRELYLSVKKINPIEICSFTFYPHLSQFAFFHLELFHPTLWFAVVIVLVLV